MDETVIRDCTYKNIIYFFFSNVSVGLSIKIGVISCGFKYLKLCNEADFFWGGGGGGQMHL